MFCIKGNQYYTESSVIAETGEKITLCVYNSDKKSSFLSISGEGVNGDGNFQYLPAPYLDEYLKGHGLELDVLVSSYPALLWFFRYVMKQSGVRESIGEEVYGNLKEVLEDKRFQ